MEPLVHNVSPWHEYQLRVAPVGPIAFTVPPRFRQSTASMPWRYDPYWTGRRASRLGGNIQDGDHASYETGGMQARTIDSRWNGNRSFKHQYGYQYHDIAPLAKFAIPNLTPQGDIDWRNKTFKVTNVNRPGRLFLPKQVPPFGLKGIQRSGTYPTATADGGDQGPVRPGGVTAGLESGAPPRVPGQGENLPNRERQRGAGPRHNGPERGFTGEQFYGMGL